MSNWSKEEIEKFREFLKEIPTGGWTDENKLLELFKQDYKFEGDLFFNTKPLLNYESKSNKEAKS